MPKTIIIFLILFCINYCPDTWAQNKKSYLIEKKIPKPGSEDPATWQIPLRKESTSINEPSGHEPEEFQIPKDKENLHYPNQIFGIFLTPTFIGFKEKFYGGDEIRFRSISENAFRTTYEYEFDFHHSLGGYLSAYQIKTENKNLGFVELQKYNEQILNFVLFYRWNNHLGTLKRKLSFDLMINRQDLPLIDFAKNNQLQLKFYEFDPIFLNVACRYQNHLIGVLDMDAFAQIGTIINHPNEDGLKLNRATRFVFGAEVFTNLEENWHLHLGFENTSDFTEVKTNTLINQSFVNNMLLRLGFTYSFKTDDH